MEQGILLERKMAEMPFAQHHAMVEALASDRAHE
jgi:hypothetical protein